MLTVLALIMALGGAVMVAAQDGGDGVPIDPTNAGQLAELAVLDTQSQEAYDTAVSADGRWLAVANSNGVWLYSATDLAAGARELDADATLVTSLAFSPDGALLATGSADGGVRLTDTASGERRALINAHNAIVTDVAFSPDGALLATASVDGTVRLWRTADGQGVAQLAGPASVVSRVLFSPDGTLLLATGSNGTVRAWNVPVTPGMAAAPAQPTPTAPPVIEPTPAPAGFPTPVYAQVQGAEQVFEHGRMFWIRHLRQVWVMAASSDDENSGDWFCFADAFQEGDPETDPSLVPPEGLYQPKRGFGLIWREKEGIRDRLGWALTPEFELLSDYTYIAGGQMQNGQYVAGPGEHRLTTLYGDAISFYEREVRGDCMGGTWRLSPNPNPPLQAQ